MELIYREGVFSREIFDRIEDYCLIPINDKWVIISVRIPKGRVDSFEEAGYATIPKIYGLSDQAAAADAGVLDVRKIGTLGLKGAGTFVAIIDTGINWRHEAFIKADGTSKIEVFWDQESDRIYFNEDFNSALLGEGDEKIPLDENGHGTFMAGIAAGREVFGQAFTGIAPEAGLIVVKLRQAKKFLKDLFFTADDAVCYAETDIIRAIKFIEDYGNDKKIPISYVIGLGTSLGAHNGTSPLCDILEDEAGKIGRCVTIAAGNSGNDRLHFRAEGEENKPKRVEIRTSDKTKGFTCEIWSAQPAVYAVEIISPTGQIINKVPARTGQSEFNFLFENTTVYVYYRLFESLSGQNVVVIRFENPSEGIWTLNVYGQSTDGKDFNVWIMNREFFEEDTFFLSSDPYVTIMDPANASSCITVAAYDYRDGSIYLNNSRGYNTYRAIKPDFCAPGVNLKGPGINSADSYVVKSGTSVSAAFFGGIAALYLEYGIVRGKIPFIRTSDIRSITIAGCQRKEGLVYPNREWGYGTVNFYNSLESLRR